MNKIAAKGLIFNIQRDSTEDGPGIRTTVFLKGCPMRCPWCHNPEGIKRSPELVWYETRCVGAGECVKACPENALTLSLDGVIINRKDCEACGACTKACPAKALEVLGDKFAVEEIAAKVLRDRVFYEKSGGGITISGGEPSLQPDFTLALMKMMRSEGIHVALDTCGGAGWDTLEPLVELADLVLYDIKLMDEDLHLKHTGLPLKLVLENAGKISKMGKPMWIRTPVIPGYTDNGESIRGIARFIADTLTTALRYDILAFNNTCTAKYQRLGQLFVLAEEELINEETMKKLAGIAMGEGLDFVHWSGMTKLSATDKTID